MEKEVLEPKGKGMSWGHMAAGRENQQCGTSSSWSRSHGGPTSVKDRVCAPLAQFFITVLLRRK